MAKKWIGLSMLLMLVQLLSAQTIIQPTDDEKLIMDRFEYIRLVKNYTGDVFWSKFSTQDFPGTIVYFTEDASYFIHPKPEMKEKVSKYSVMENDYNWTIWKLRMPLDSAKFVMETQFQFDAKSKGYINYKTPVLFCSSPELTKKEKEVMNTTQEWSVALLHELYHQFQYSNEAIMTYVLRLYQEKKMIDMDSLQGIYLANKEYRDTLTLENDLLKKAVDATSFEEEKKLFAQFLKLRSKRQLAYFKKTKFWVTTPENFWEKLEGTCLMMEHHLKEKIHEVEPPAALLERDKMYQQGFRYDEESDAEKVYYNELDDDRFYVGTTGYNMVRLLEKNNVPYKENFLNYAALPLDLQLKYFYKIK